MGVPIAGQEAEMTKDKKGDAPDPLPQPDPQLFGGAPVVQEDPDNPVTYDSPPFINAPVHHLSRAPLSPHR